MAAELLQIAADENGARRLQGGAPAMTDLLGGHIPLLFASMAPLCLTSNRARSSARGHLSGRVPAIPTCRRSRSSLSGFEALVWFAVVGPAKLPADLVAKLSRALTDALDDRSVRTRSARLGTSGAGTPAQLAATIRDDLEKWRKVVREANIRSE